jgi:hypothetical protein
VAAALATKITTAEAKAVTQIVRYADDFIVGWVARGFASVVATLDDDCERGDQATFARSRRIAQPRSGKSAADSRPVC